MSSQQPIKVIKRAERIRLEEEAAGVTSPEFSVLEKARGLVATVEEWVSETRRTRLVQRQEFKNQLGWGEGVADQTDRELRGLVKGEK